jgi:hypothetical protein
MLGAAMSAPSSSSPAKRTLLEAIVGAFLGFVGWNFIGPATIGLWYQPLSAGALSCGPTVSQGLSQFVFVGFWVTAVAAIGTVILMFVIRRKLRARSAPATGTTPA